MLDKLKDGEQYAVESKGIVYNFGLDKVKIFNEYFEAYAERDLEKLKKQYPAIKKEIQETIFHVESCNTSIKMSQSLIFDLRQIKKNISSQIGLEVSIHLDNRKIIRDRINDRTKNPLDVPIGLKFPNTYFNKLSVKYTNLFEKDQRNNDKLTRGFTLEEVKVLKKENKLSNLYKNSLKRIEESLNWEIRREKENIVIAQEQNKENKDWLKVLKDMKETLRLELHDVQREFNKQFILDNFIAFNNNAEITLQDMLSKYSVEEIEGAKKELKKFIETGVIPESVKGKIKPFQNAKFYRPTVGVDLSESNKTEKVLKFIEEVEIEEIKQ